MTGLANQIEPFMIFDPSEFEGPRFDCIAFHNILKLVSKEMDVNEHERTSNVTLRKDYGCKCT